MNELVSELLIPALVIVAAYMIMLAVAIGGVVGRLDRIADLLEKK